MAAVLHQDKARAGDAVRHLLLCLGRAQQILTARENPRVGTRISVRFTAASVLAAQDGFLLALESLLPDPLSHFHHHPGDLRIVEAGWDGRGWLQPGAA